MEYILLFSIYEGAAILSNKEVFMGKGKKNTEFLA